MVVDTYGAVAVTSSVVVVTSGADFVTSSAVAVFLLLSCGFGYFCAVKITRYRCG